jgi:hypothetical protein
MKVRELITLLQQCAPESTVTVWDAYSDSPSQDVKVSQSEPNETHVGVWAFGTKVEPKPTEVQP